MAEIPEFKETVSRGWNVVPYRAQRRFDVWVGVQKESLADFVNCYPFSWRKKAFFNFQVH